MLLGLTATPERADGKSVLHWFGGRVAAELRLWDALDQELLSPFQYFVLHDGTDLSQVDFRGGRYDVDSLERLYTADQHRALAVLRGLQSKVRSPRRMRALGFCVSVRHAEYVVAPTLFHWQSQSVTREDSETGRRYQSPPDDWRLLLFVRRAKRDERGLTQPFLFLGPVRYVSHEGERPMSITWRLESPLPGDWFQPVKIAAG